MAPKVGTNALHSQTTIRGGMEGQNSSGICPLKPASCRSLQLIDGWPGGAKIASGIVIQEPVPQIEQPPSSGISEQAPPGGTLVDGA